MKGFTNEVNHSSDFGCEEDGHVHNGVIPEAERSGWEPSCGLQEKDSEAWMM